MESPVEEFIQAAASKRVNHALYIGEPIEIPEPADSIYLAFDRGEYAINGEDPIVEHTRPALRRILASLSDKS